MTLLDEIQHLPEGIAQDKLISFFERSLMCKDKDVALDSLVDLADRQWHTYEKINSEIASRLEPWLLDYWNRRSLSDAERLISIVGRLGLVSVFAKMKEELLNLPIDVKIAFQSFFEEIGESVADPYKGMK